MGKWQKFLIFYFTTSILPWSWSHSTSLFWAFFLDMVYIFIIQKISPNEAGFNLFLTLALILAKFVFKNVMKFCWCKIWVITMSKSAKYLVWWVYWMKNKCLLLSTFCTFQTPLTLLTYSALSLNPLLSIHMKKKTLASQKIMLKFNCFSISKFELTKDCP